MVTWGSLYVATTVALRSTPPLTLLFFRYAVASAALAVPIVVGKRNIRIPRRDWPGVFLIGAVGYFLSVAIQNYGTMLAGASAASLVNAMTPISITALAVCFLRERFTAAKAFATVCAIAGAVVVLSGGGSGGAALGIVLSIVAVFFWSLSSILARRVTAWYDPLAVSCWGMFVAMACSLPAAAVELAVVPHGQLFSRENVASVAYLGIVATALPSVLWNMSLARIDASVCGLFYPIQPLVSVALGATLLGERVGLRFAVGAALIIVGVVVAILSQRRPRGIFPSGSAAPSSSGSRSVFPGRKKAPSGRAQGR